MKNKTPKVSIIIPVYNGSNYLKEAIDSAIAQTYKNIEIIVVNDGSSDDGATEAIAKSYGKKIRYYKKENGGVATALNMGIKKMTGEYFSWLSHDDMYCLDKIEKQILFINKMKLKDAVLYSDYIKVDVANNTESEVLLNGTLFDNKQQYLLFREALNGVTMLVPKTALCLCGNFNEKLRTTQDYDMWYRIMKKGYKFIHMNAILAKYRVHENQDTLKDGRVQTEKDDLFLYFIKSTSQQDMELLEGSEYNFYIQTRLYLKNVNLPNTHKFLKEQISKKESCALSEIKNSSARIAVITPTYNRADFIRETMSSVFDQDYGDYTYIILDDGSIDDTGEIVTRAIAGRPNCYYLYHDNIGEAETMNLGWSICQNEYFIQINSDDLVDPNLFSEMVKALDKDSKAILAYPDFYIIDVNGKIISRRKNYDFELSEALSLFSCFPACPGTIIRKSSLTSWTKIRDSKYRYISDIDMLWKMALLGNFIHVPKSLASWRSHENGISNDRYKSIAEVDVWTNEFFSQKDLPKDIKDLEIKCRQSIFDYYARLMSESGLGYAYDMANYYWQKEQMPTPRYSNLQVGDNDLIGNKFNGHDLHQYLRDRNIESYHLVLNKQSDDKNTYVIGAEKALKTYIRQYTTNVQRLYDLDCISNPLMYDVLYNKLFLDADVVHFHLMHNGILDLQMLPIVSRLKPIVWTLHDTWSVLGDPIDDPSSEHVFPSEIKNLGLNYEIRREAFANSNIVFIAASKTTQKILERSKLFNGKKIFHVPFGLNLDIFYPRDKQESRRELGIQPSEKVVILRGNVRNTKGLDYIEYVMKNIGLKHDIRFIIVGGNELIVPSNVKTSCYGWVNDEQLMAKLYSAADLLLMPSKREGFGMMAIEAMACGTVPIVIDGTALPETVNAPNCGYSTPRNKKEYCDAVERFLKDSEDRSNRSDLCIEYVKNNYGIKKYVDSIEKVYQYAMSYHNIDDDSKKMLNDLRLHSQIMPRLNDVPNGPFYKRFSVAWFRQKGEALSYSFHTHGFVKTFELVTKKIYKKSVSTNRLMIIKKLSSNYAIFKKSLIAIGPVGTIKKIIAKVSHNRG